MKCGARLVQPSSDYKSASVSRWFYAALIILLAALPPAYPHSHYELPSICPFHFITGIPCPGCGMGRSLICFFHGQLSASLVFHPLGWLVGTTLIMLVVSPTVFQNTYQQHRKACIVILYIVTILLVLFWVLRLAHIMPDL